MKRKIIQIVDVPESQVAQGCLTALCDDGTIWYLATNKWELIQPQIPQDFVMLDERERILTNVCRYGGDFPCNPGCENGC